MPKPKINESDLCRAAKRLGTTTAEVETFLSVETKNKGFDAQDRPLILFERHWFHKLTKGKYDASHPNISNAKAGGYGKSSEQYSRFSVAFGLNPDAAMKSASWGLGQVMGFNHAIVGYPTVGEFVDAMKVSEGHQLDAAIEYIIHNDLDDELRRHDWAAFARGYNGKNYKINDYDTKLKNAYDKFKTRKIKCSQVSAAIPVQPTVETKTVNTPQEPATQPPIVPLEVASQPAVAVPQVVAAVEVPAETPKEDTLTKVGNKFNALWTLAGTSIIAAGTWLTSTPTGIAVSIIGAAALIGIVYMLITTYRATKKESRDAATKAEQVRLETELKLQREKQAHEIQMKMLDSAADPNQNAVVVAPPPATQMEAPQEAV